MTGVGRAARTPLALAGLLALAFAVRAARRDQPIVENYVGRQVPTAMVARNLLRGSGFLRPSLDVAPFPNLFLVEPPLFAAAASGLERASGLPLGASGRLVSALGVVLGAWGLFDLVARRDGDRVGLAAVAAFAALPVTVRYGRAFQPDALMLGAWLAGIACWDRFEAGRGRFWLATALSLVAAGLALKVTSAGLALPLALGVWRARTPGRLALLAAAAVPAALWYVHAGLLLSEGSGSRASADNGAIWLGTLAPLALLRAETWRHVGRALAYRAFTPVGTLLGPFACLGNDRLWRAWGLSGLATLAVLAAKLHHEYYWLLLAPLAAAGVGRAVVRIGAFHRPAAVAVALAFLGLAGWLGRSTYSTPAEWAGVVEAASVVRELVPRGEWVVGPEALLFQADRRGCRLELSSASAARASGEWGKSLDDPSPAGLVEFYRRNGAGFFADVAPAGASPGRLALHAAVRRRYKIVVDRPGVVLLARLVENGPDASEPPHGPGPRADAETP